jgi:hypothetical protein
MVDRDNFNLLPLYLKLTTNTKQLSLLLLILKPKCNSQNYFVMYIICLLTLGSELTPNTVN